MTDEDLAQLHRVDVAIRRVVLVLYHRWTCARSIGYPERLVHAYAGPTYASAPGRSRFELYALLDPAAPVLRIES